MREEEEEEELSDEGRDGGSIDGTWIYLEAL